MKTHSHLEIPTVELALSLETQLIISIRDLRDAMISRYFHVMAEPTHWQHGYIGHLPVEEGFLLSLTRALPEDSDSPIEYYYRWIRDWRIFAEQNQNLPIIWYEQWQGNEVRQIESILNLLGLDNYFDSSVLADCLFNLREKQRTRTLTENLRATSRNKSTLREGRTETWKQFMSSQLLLAFEETLPGPTADVYFDCGTAPQQFP